MFNTLTMIMNTLNAMFNLTDTKFLFEVSNIPLIYDRILSFFIRKNSLTQYYFSILSVRIKYVISPQNVNIKSIHSSFQTWL